MNLLCIHIFCLFFVTKREHMQRKPDIRHAQMYSLKWAQKIHGEEMCSKLYRGGCGDDIIGKGAAFIFLTNCSISEYPPPPPTSTTSKSHTQAQGEQPTQQQQKQEQKNSSRSPFTFSERITSTGNGVESTKTDTNENDGDDDDKCGQAEFRSQDGGFNFSCE